MRRPLGLALAALVTSGAAARAQEAPAAEEAPAPVQVVPSVAPVAPTAVAPQGARPSLPRLALTSDDTLALKRARGKEAGGVVLCAAGVSIAAVGASFYAPLATGGRVGSLDAPAAAGVGTAVAIAGLAVLGGGIELFLQGYRTAVDTVERAWHRGGLQYSLAAPTTLRF